MDGQSSTGVMPMDALVTRGAAAHSLPAESSKVVTVLGRTGPVGTWGGSDVSIGAVLFISMTGADATGAVTMGSELAFVVGLADLCGGSEDAAGRRCSRAFRVASSGTSEQM